MNDLIDRALDAAQRGGADYADIRLVERLNESLTVKNGALEAANSSASAGFGVRVLVDGAWGFSASSLLEADEVESVTREALEIASASGAARLAPVELDDTPPITDSYRTPYDEDPFEVSLDDKLRILMDADAAMGACRVSRSARGRSWPAVSARRSRPWPARESSRRSSSPAAGSRRPR